MQDDSPRETARDGTIAPHRETKRAMRDARFANTSLLKRNVPSYAPLTGPPCNYR
jgi:hypothetical protein